MVLSVQFEIGTFGLLLRQCIHAALELSMSSPHRRHLVGCFGLPVSFIRPARSFTPHASPPARAISRRACFSAADDDGFEVLLMPVVTRPFKLDFAKFCHDSVCVLCSIVADHDDFPSALAITQRAVCLAVAISEFTDPCHSSSTRSRSRSALSSSGAVAISLEFCRHS